jgi:hypothetical protein
MNQRVKNPGFACPSWPCVAASAMNVLPVFYKSTTKKTSLCGMSIFFLKRYLIQINNPLRRRSVFSGEFVDFQEYFGIFTKKPRKPEFSRRVSQRV